MPVRHPCWCFKTLMSRSSADQMLGDDWETISVGTTLTELQGLFGIALNLASDSPL